MSKIKRRARQDTLNKIACNYSWDTEEKKAYREAGGGWNGIEAVIGLDQRRFYGK